MAKTAHFEVVHSDAGWHARFRARNGRILWSTEIYTRQGAARNAIDLLARPMDARLTRVGVRTITDKVPPVVVRDVDERAR